MNARRVSLFILLLVLLSVFTVEARAQERVPDPPAPDGLCRTPAYVWSEGCSIMHHRYYWNMNCKTFQDPPNNLASWTEWGDACEPAVPHEQDVTSIFVPIAVNTGFVIMPPPPVP